MSKGVSLSCVTTVRKLSIVLSRSLNFLDHLVTDLQQRWNRLLRRSESKDPGQSKHALAHITHWKADVARSARRRPKPIEERGLNISQGNHLVYVRWHNRSPQEVLAWHRQVQKDVLAALQEAPEKWFSEESVDQIAPGDIDGHSTYHRVKDIEWVLKKTESECCPAAGTLKYTGPPPKYGQGRTTVKLPPFAPAFSNEKFFLML